MNIRKTPCMLSLKRVLILLIGLSVLMCSHVVINVKAQSQNNIVDGVISDGEYQFELTLGEGDFSLYWRNITDEIYFGIEGQTTGWVALGIDPIVMMENADMIMGFVTNEGQVEILDAYSTGLTGPHPPDIELGGTNDILEYNGTENNGVTTIEVKRKLTTNDQYDKPVPSDRDIKIIWALSIYDDFDRPHIKRGSGIFSFEGVSASYRVDFFPYLVLGTSLFIALFGLLFFVDSTGRKRQEQEQAQTKGGNN
ncbi:MAG: DOMON domain-containing protein [Candidatus Hodarchaeota archaeon]